MQYFVRSHVTYWLEEVRCPLNDTYFKGKNDIIPISDHIRTYGNEMPDPLKI